MDGAALGPGDEIAGVMIGKDRRNLDCIVAGPGGTELAVITDADVAAAVGHLPGDVQIRERIAGGRLDLYGGGGGTAIQNQLVGIRLDGNGIGIAGIAHQSSPQ